MVIIGLLIKPLVYYLFGLYRRLWAYASINELTLIAAAVSVASAIFSAIMLTLYVVRFHDTRIINFPRTFSRSTGCFRWWALAACASPSACWQKGAQPVKRPVPRKARNVLIIGAGDAGALVVREMQKNPQLGLRPVGYLDDDRPNNGTKCMAYRWLAGWPTCGAPLNIARWMRSSLPSPAPAAKSSVMVTDICRLKGIPFRTMPGLFELIGGKVSVNRLREVDITDLLRREPARIQDELVGAALIGKACAGHRRRRLHRPRDLPPGRPLGTRRCSSCLGTARTVFLKPCSNYRKTSHHLPLQPVIADIRDKPRIQSVFADFRPQVVFHAAAHKHVPLMESNVEDAITNNIIGTQNVVQAASVVNTERLVLISTDKAVRPANVMGATKRIAEMIVLEAAHRTGQALLRGPVWECTGQPRQRGPAL